MQLSVQDLAHTIDMEADYLIGRSEGSRFAKFLREQIKLASADSVISLDFGDVDLMDGSFADEVFAAIATERGRGGFAGAPMVLCRLNPTSRDNLEQALLSRPVRELGLRNCVIPLLSSTGELQLCGKSEEHVRQTFDILVTYGELTTKTVADLLDLTVSAAGTRLKVVFDLGLALRIETRDSMGKQYIYRKPL